jgi:hypothetical protein
MLICKESSKVGFMLGVICWDYGLNIGEIFVEFQINLVSYDCSLHALTFLHLILYSV